MKVWSLITSGFLCIKVSSSLRITVSSITKLWCVEREREREREKGVYGEEREGGGYKKAKFNSKTIFYVWLLKEMYDKT